MTDAEKDAAWRSLPEDFKKADGSFGRSYTRYLFDGKVYKSHKSCVEAINRHLEMNKHE